MESRESTAADSNEDRGSTGKPLRQRIVALVVSAVFCVALSVCYWWQPDRLAGLTLVPAWCWLVPAFVLTRYGMNRKHKLWSIPVLVVWILFTAIFVEEATSLLRYVRWPTTEWESAREQGRAIRVISFNCIGNSQAAREVIEYEPDILLLQESPNHGDVARLNRELFGEDGTFAWNGDLSILVRGNVNRRGPEARSHFIHTTIELPTGQHIDVINLRLSPPVYRLDFWTPAFWTDHRDNRVERREQILKVMEQTEEIPESRQLILGGDFNSPANVAAIVPLQERLCDTFRKAGRGWGNTGTNRFPLFRVDQVWTSRDMRAVSVTAHKTINSDHRMVVCDLILQE